MGQGQIGVIKDTIEVVENNIKQISDLQYLSEEMAVSQYHLHRMFRSITGKTLMTYVRNRKLSLSLMDLMNTDLKIIDIANEYQFEYEQSYIRAFKQMFQMTPSQFRKNPCHLPIEPKIDTNKLSNVGEGVVIQPRMVIEPLFYLQGIQEEIVHDENYEQQTTNQLAEKFWSEYRPQIPNQKGDEIYYGLINYSDNPYYSNYYATCVETTVLNQVDSPFVQFTIPTAEYAVFRYIGLHNPHKITYQTLFELYQYTDNWIHSTAYEQVAPYHFEKLNFKLCQEDYCEMDLFYPIRATNEKKSGVS